MPAPRRVSLALIVAATLLAGCQPMHRDGPPFAGGAAEPYGRTWADPGAARPDLPPDRDAGKD